MAPIDYNSMLTQLDVTPLLQAAQIRDQRKERKEATAQRQQTIDLDQRRFAVDQQQELDKRNERLAAKGRTAAFMERWKEVADHPSAQGYASLRADFPDQVETIGTGQKAFNDQQAGVSRDIVSGIHSNIVGGDATTSLTAIDDGIQRFGQMGRPVTQLQTLRTMVASGKPNQMQAARRIANMMVAQESGGDFGPVLNSLNRDQQDADLDPFRRRRAAADADYAETRADYAPGQQQELLRGRQVRNANTADLLHRRDLPRPAPAPRAPAPIRPRAGERTASDGKGGVFVVRGGQWVKAQ